ncbi:hypothetical protein ACOZ4N_00085 (plasmid) [Halorientalis pallida]|uniref:hypothetical protein n=1 Tax=Halorientalis pallida TaxID=2479928 RepID=UPI003C6FDA57
MVVAESLWAAGSVFSMLGLGVVGCCCQQQQQQQQTLNLGDDSDEPKRICPECGIENPREADYCGDCGYSFKSGNTDSDE